MATISPKYKFHARQQQLTMHHHRIKTYAINVGNFSRGNVDGGDFVFLASNTYTQFLVAISLCRTPSEWRCEMPRATCRPNSTSCRVPSDMPELCMPISRQLWRYLQNTRIGEPTPARKKTRYRECEKIALCWQQLQWEKEKKVRWGKFMQICRITSPSLPQKCVFVRKDGKKLFW